MDELQACEQSRRPSAPRGLLAPALLVMCFAVASSATPDATLPNGFGDARFRMNAAQVRKIYPDVKLVLDTAAAEDKQASTSVPTFVVLRLPEQEVLGLEPCTLDLRFAEDQLYFIQADCGSDEKVREALVAAYGDPAMEGGAAYWLGDKKAISLNVKSMKFAFIDRKLDQLVQGALRRAIVESGQLALPPEDGR